MAKKGTVARMDENLMSKRELLDTYGISYGTLYRWRRTGLIPEDWFIRKSTPTGQETFFPRDLITERVNFIMSEKDSASLDELAGRVSKKNERVFFVVETKYGEKSFLAEDVLNIKFVCGERTVEIAEIASLLKEKK